MGVDQGALHARAWGLRGGLLNPWSRRCCLQSLLQDVEVHRGARGSGQEKDKCSGSKGHTRHGPGAGRQLAERSADDL